MFSLSLLQSINDWQIGGSPSVKGKRGKILQKEFSQLPDEYRICYFSCFRKIDLEKGILWKLADDLLLPETISAWTIETSIAQKFKGGVPASGIQAIIFTLQPTDAICVVANLSKIYRDQEFLNAVEKNKNNIKNFELGIGRWGNSQAEVVMEVKNITIDNIYEMGGFSSSREKLVKELYGSNPTKLHYADFDFLVGVNSIDIGGGWVSGAAKDKVLKKIKDQMPALRTIKQLQEKKSLC